MSMSVTEANWLRTLEARVVAAEDRADRIEHRLLALEAARKAAQERMAVARSARKVEA